MNYSDKYIKHFNEVLMATEVTTHAGEITEVNQAFNNLCNLNKEVKEKKGILYFIGNGASSNMASHYAIDFLKNAGCPANCFTDDAFLTAIGNDIGYDQVFAVPLKSFLTEHDCLITISSSGNSENILESIKVAKSVNCKIVTFSGMQDDNQSRKLGDINFYVPAKTYGFVESAHHLLLHCWLDQYMNVEEWAQ